MPTEEGRKGKFEKETLSHKQTISTNFFNKRLSIEKGMSDKLLSTVLSACSL